MAKRPKLDYDINQLTQNLEQSTGKGVNAFFSEPSPSQSEQSIQNETTSKPKKQVAKKVHQPKPPAQSTNQLTGRVLDKPVAFYIPETINNKITEAVAYYQGNYGKKIDRSAVISAFLSDPNGWTEEALDKLADRVVDQLTNRLTSRLTNRPID